MATQKISDWAGSPLFVCENVAVILKTMSRVTNILLYKPQSARKILLSGNRMTEILSSKIQSALKILLSGNQI